MKILVSQKIEAIAGSEKYLLYLLPALKQKGIQVEFLTLYPKNERHKIKEFEEKIAAFNIPSYVQPINNRPTLSQLKSISHLIKNGNYDLVHANLLHADLIFAMIKLFFNRKMILVSGKHGYEPDYTHKYGFDASKKRRDIYWWCARFAEKFINRAYAISKGLYDLYIGLNISKKERIDLLYYGFDFDDNYVTDKYKYGQPQLAVVGRLTAFKGHRYALEALALLKHKYPKITLVIVGWGELEEELKKLTADLGLSDNVVFTGFHPKPREIMYNSDIVLLPSVSEGFGIVVLEAMSVKRPVVAFNVPSPSEIFVHGETGLLATPYSVVEYATLIERLIEEPAYGSTLAGNAYKRLKGYFNLDRMIDETISFYKKALATK